MSVRCVLAAVGEVKKQSTVSGGTASGSPIDLVSSDGTRIVEHMQPQKKVARLSDYERELLFGRATNLRRTPSPAASPEVEIEEDDNPLTRVKA
eukprot:scaffold178900_cov14-Prasinocladus_malaysianus.AAC.1